MKVVIAAGGRFHAFHLASQLEKRNALKKIYTGYYSDNDKDYLSERFVKNNNLFKAIDFLYSKLRFYKFLNKSNLHRFKDNIFDNWLSKNISQEKADIFVGWSNYFGNNIENIKKIGAKIIVESGSTHILEQQELLEREYKDFGAQYLPINKKTVNKILSEYNAADYIMSPSNFTKNSFLKHGVSESKLLTVNYGVNYDFFSKIKKLEPDKFRVIFVGLVGLRKGVQYLIQAWNKLNLPEEKTELLFVGNMLSDIKPFLKNTKTLNVSFELKKNVIFYGSTDRNTLAKLYSKSSLFVLPSIEEGLSMTIAEAMSCGLPVVCSTNTGALDLIEENKHGFIVPIRDVDVLAERILWCYKNQEQCRTIGLAGKSKIQSLTWDFYGQNVYDVYKKIV